MTAVGFEPFFDKESVLLILGSFPSVMSRAEGFYYGNPQNRFWKTVCGYFGESAPKTVDEKKAFLKRRKIALWDVVTSCEIDGSKDASIREERVADLPALLKKSKIKTIFCNGNKSYELLEREFPALINITQKLSSTSPANPRFTAEAWFKALDEVFL
ncbi:MAG: DNA-deoxyinosine glycosylase [Clostridia bacterium]|nr:DNA-deoxyinosine glycosylase [Clostridia bacterium]